MSNTSADHAVTIDPLTAERIEVLRGPAVLLYGSQAIGGAVNVIDKRIPRRVPRRGDPYRRSGPAMPALIDRVNGGLSVDVPLAPRLIVHADAAYSDSGDLEVGGFTVAPELRADLLAEADEDEAEDPEEAEELREAAAQRGVLAEQRGRDPLCGYGHRVRRRGRIRSAFRSAITTRITASPGRPGAGHGHGEEEGEEGEEEEEGEAPRSPLTWKQLRFDLRGNALIGGDILDEVRIRAGYSDYTHTEFEGDEVGTVFRCRGN